MKMYRLATAVVALAIGVTSAFAQTEPGAFINRLCNSSASLADHARSDARVMDRYMRHFAMTEEEVVSYLRSLRLTTMKEDAMYVVYGAPDAAPLRSKVMKVKKGTKVFVDEGGQVSLIWHCGNPVTRGPKQPLASAAVGAEPEGSPEADLRLMPTTAPSSMIQASMPTEFEPTVPEVPDLPIEDDIPIASVARVPGWLGIIPAIAVITNRKTGNNPVPEPATIIALTAGVGVIAARRRKKA